MLPLYQFPNIAAWRTDKVGGPVDEYAGNYLSAFKNLNKWEPDGGDRDHHRRRAVAGLHQPGHGVRQLLVDGVDDRCSRSFPSVWDTTADGVRDHRPGDREPTVETPADPQLSRVHDHGSGLWGRLRAGPTAAIAGEGGAVLRYTSPSLAVGHPHAVHRHVPGVRRAPGRHRPGGRATCGSNPRATPAKIQQYKEVNGLIGRSAGAVLPLAAATSSPATGATPSRATARSGRR